MRKRNDRVGETRISNYGMEMTIIEYNSWNNVIVRFQDGYIKRTTYRNFILGKVINPSGVIKKMANIRVGETRMSNYGMEMTIIEYNSATNIVVRFQDGYTKRTDYKTFKMGKINNPNYHINKHIGETSMANCGMEMTIIDYNNVNDVTVKFQDGYIKRGAAYKCFKNGSIANPNYRANIHVGETNTATCGLLMVIIEYNSWENLIVRFEDGYTKRVHYDSFKSGMVGHILFRNNKRKSFNYHRLTCNFIYSDKTDYYYVCKCPKCGYDEILSTKELVELGDHKCEGNIQ